MRNHVIIIGNDKGGVGKDPTPKALKIAFQKLDLDHNLIEVKRQKRLDHLYPDLDSD